MSILIPGKMPTCCWDCPCAYETEGVHHNYCQAVGYDTKLPDDGRPDWCPLIELPPHGRLIDADALLEDHGLGTYCPECKRDERSCQYEMIYTTMDFCEWIEDAETVIPASGGTDG